MTVKLRFSIYLVAVSALVAGASAQQRGGTTGTTTQQGGGTTTQSQAGVPNSGTTTTQTQQNGSISGTIGQIGLGIPVKKATVEARQIPTDSAGGIAIVSADSLGGQGTATTGGQSATNGGGGNQGQGNNQGGGGRGGNGGVTKTATTDNNGMYTITGLAAGRYRVTATAQGFVKQEFGQQSLDDPGTPVNVTGNGTQTVDIQLMTGGFIDGTAMDEDGAPMVNAQVQLYTADYSTGQRMLVASKTAQTNDIGGFRLPALDPGEYYLAASPSTAQSMLAPDTAIPQSVANPTANQRGAQNNRNRGRGGTATGQAAAPVDVPPSRAYPPTFFPSTTDPSQAVAIQITPGFEARAINVTLRPVQLVSIRGTIIAPAGITLATPQPPQQNNNNQGGNNQNQQQPNLGGGAGRTQGGAGGTTGGTTGGATGGATGGTGGGGRGNNLAAAPRGGGGGRGGGGQGTQQGAQGDPGGGGNQGGQTGGQQDPRGGRGNFPNDQGFPGGQNGFNDPAASSTIMLMPIGIKNANGGGGGGRGGGGNGQPNGGGGGGRGGGGGGRGNNFAAAPRGGGGGRGGGGQGGFTGGQGGFNIDNISPEMLDRLAANGIDVNDVLARAGNGGNGGNNDRAVGGTQPVRISANQDGTFQVDNVIPGSYIAYASARSSNSVQLTAFGRLEVSFGNIDNYAMVLQQGVAVPGQIYLDGQAPENFKVQDVRIELTAMDNLPFGNPRATVGTDSKFSITNVAPGRYRLNFSRVPNGSYVAKALVGGVDALGEVFQLDGDGTPIQVLLGFTQGRIDVAVEQAGKPFNGGRVLLAPANRNRLDLFKTTTSDKDGKASFANVPPGNYKLFAWESLAKAKSYENPKFLETFEDHGRPVSVEKSSTIAEGHLQVMPAVQ